MRGQVIVRIKAGNHFALRNWMIPAVRHILFAGPEKFHGRARNLFGDKNCLTHIVVRRRTAAESAAEEGLVDFALLHRQTARLRCRSKRGFTVLRRAPHLALVGRIKRGGVHRLHGRMVLIGIAVDRFDFLGGARERGFHIPALVADECLCRRQGLLSARRQSMRSTPWHCRPHPTRSAGHRGLFSRATNCPR